MLSSFTALLHLWLCYIAYFSLQLFAGALPQQIGHGYRLGSLEESPGGGGLIGYLQVKQSTATYGHDIPHLRLFVRHETRDRLRVHITDAENERREVPYDLLPREPAPASGNSSGKPSGNTFTASEYAGDELVFSYIADPFGFAVRRKSNGQTLFNSSYGAMIFKDQYLEISTQLPGIAALYGLGENTQPGGIRLRPNDPYTLYTTDISAINLNTDLYGSHPVYMDLRNVEGEASAHAVLLLSSNGMDVFYRGSSLTYKVIGGVFDFYFFAGPTPLAVVDQYTSFIGRPAPMPYWALDPFLRRGARITSSCITNGVCLFLYLTHFVSLTIASFMSHNKGTDAAGPCSA